MAGFIDGCRFFAHLVSLATDFSPIVRGDEETKANSTVRPSGFSIFVLTVGNSYYILLSINYTPFERTGSRRWAH
jgi:hypothetical protein